MNRSLHLAFTLAALLGTGAAPPAGRVLTPRLHHLRADGPREWSDFPQRAEGTSLTLRFGAERNASEWALRLRQQDVRETWRVLLNGAQLGRLHADENDMVVYFPVPAGRLLSGENRLVIEQVGRTSDDIRVGEIYLEPRPVSRVLNEATVEVSVHDGDSGKPTPCRLTIVDAQGALMMTGAQTGGHLAVRPGVIYTGTGRARFGLPAGEYTVYAGRGFAYSLASWRVKVRPGELARKELHIRREVPTPGYVSCDPHVHTLTYSGHGDATADERALTLAGEGVELPVSAEHNRQVDYDAAAVKMKVRDYFTPVTGNEVTTAVGHFNIFPVRPGAAVPDYKAKDWKSVGASIRERAGLGVVILNHARDLHSKFRPFGPERHIALTGEALDGWALPANAMEVINSGAQQTDVMRLFHDWFGLLNRGVILTPVGASDSHDVSRYIVGQGRTYIRSTADHPGKIDTQEAVENFAKGRVLVSCGLLAEITVNGKYGPGELAPAADEVKVAVRVLGPGWVEADRVELYVNGRKAREARIAGGKKPGVKWQGNWALPRLRHDVHLVAVATGPGVTGLYWPIAKPYQPTSPKVTPRVLGATGAVWIDGDGDGKRTSAYEYARRIVAAEGARLPRVVEALAAFDEAVAAQAAGLLRARGVASSEIREAGKKAGGSVGRGFEAYAEAWRESQMARSQDR